MQVETATCNRHLRPENNNLGYFLVRKYQRPENKSDHKISHKHPDYTNNLQKMVQI